MTALLLAVCLSAPPANCPECESLTLTVQAKVLPAPAAAPTTPPPKAAPAVSSSVTTTVTVRTGVFARQPVRSAVRGVVGTTRQVLDGVIRLPVRVVRNVFGGC